MNDIERAYTSFTWHGVECANDVRLPPWLHEYTIGWSGEHIYLSCPIEGEQTVEIGDRIEYSMIGEGNGYIEYIKVYKAQAA